MIIRELIDSIVDRGIYSDPKDISHEVIQSIAEENYQKAVEEMLLSYVRQTLSLRRLNFSIVSQDDEKKYQEQVTISTNPSAKVEACRNSWTQRKNTPLLVGTEWKRLGECTYSDLMKVATSLRERARKTLSKADWYTRLAEAIPKNGTVDDLDEEPVGTV